MLSRRPANNVSVPVSNPRSDAVSTSPTRTWRKQDTAADEQTNANSTNHRGYNGGCWSSASTCSRPSAAESVPSITPRVMSPRVERCPRFGSPGSTRSKDTRWSSRLPMPTMMLVGVEKNSASRPNRLAVMASAVSSWCAGVPCLCSALANCNRNRRDTAA